MEEMKIRNRRGNRMTKMIHSIDERLDLLEREKKHAESCRNYYNLLFIEEQITFLNSLKNVTQP